ncbi:universal stress protein [Pedococcus sp. 5OH_020]|uniref:universal stress protein n=1 Tax=Pedococcus sp. 5OH_020 TaxID=2989814 RepID=UPI0022E9EA8B|nr:universal stress protein [Pedococcus sp. 5OH_020]
MNTMNTQPCQAVVVGVDHNPSSDRAVDVGVKQARVSHRPLHLVFATGVGLVPYTREYLATKLDFLRRRRDRAAEQAPDLDITYAVQVDDPAALLVKASATASLVVLGSAGLGQTVDVLRGATAAKLMAHAHCPVMVTPHAATWDVDGPIVVGVDATEHSTPALEWAFAQASAEGAELVPVHTWWWEEPDPFLSGGSWEDEWVAMSQTQTLELSEMLAGWREKYPDVAVSPTVVRGQAAEILVEASPSSRLVVVGTRGRGGFAGLLLGSVSIHTAHRASCPVVVVPSTHP